MKQFIETFVSVRDVIGTNLVITAAAAAPLVDFLNRFLFKNYELIVLAVLTVFVSILIETICRLYKKSFTWEYIWYGVLRGFIFASILSVTHLMAWNKTGSDSIDWVLSYTDRLFYVLVLFIELNLILKNAKLVGIEFPFNPLRYFENYFNNGKNGESKGV